MLDLESEAMRGLGSIPTGSNILSLEYFLFSYSKDENVNIGISVRMWKPAWAVCQLELANQ